MEIIENWVAEFLLRSQRNLRVYGTTPLSNLKLVGSDDSAKFKIAAVLLDISNSLIKGKMDEEMLDLLEILEKLLLQEQMVMMSSLKSAYFWTAVECTCRFMWPVRASDGFFGDALERIWKKRIGILKERESNLVTLELLNWEGDLKKAFEEPEIYQKNRETNIRYKAISHLIQLLDEHWTLLGCSSLELESRKRFLKREDPPNASRRRGNDIGKASDVVDKVNEELGIGNESTASQKANEILDA